MSYSVDPREDPRAQLGRFLRARREQLRPEDLGFPRAGRRRTPGLRREEVAIAAGLSTTWYTYLEQGRRNDVSPGVLNSIARVLKLSEDERRYMYLLMYGHTPTVAVPEENIPFSELTRNIIRSTNGYPYPVYAMDHAYNLLGWNDACVDWYDDFGLLAPEERNLMRWMFASKRAREVFSDWGSVARDFVGRWRMHLTSNSLRGTTDELADQFKKEFPEFRQLWDEQIVIDRRIAIRRFRRPGSKDSDLLVVPLVTIYDRGPGIGFHFPVP